MHRLYISKSYSIINWKEGIWIVVLIFDIQLLCLIKVLYIPDGSCTEFVTYYFILYLFLFWAIHGSFLKLMMLIEKITSQFYSDNFRKF